MNFENQIVFVASTALADVIWDTKTGMKNTPDIVVTDHPKNSLFSKKWINFITQIEINDKFIEAKIEDFPI